MSSHLRLRRWLSAAGAYPAPVPYAPPVLWRRTWLFPLWSAIADRGRAAGVVWIRPEGVWRGAGHGGYAPRASAGGYGYGYGYAGRGLSLQDTVARGPMMASRGGSQWAGECARQRESVTHTGRDDRRMRAAVSVPAATSKP